MRRNGNKIACLALAVLCVSLASQARAGFQQPVAGVLVSPDGVLRTKLFLDPTGKLMREKFAAAKASLNPDIARPSKLRKISLNRLEAALADRLARGEAESDDMKYLAGLTRISHVFYYPESRDIVIAGPAEGYVVDLAGRAIGLHSRRSVLELQDLVVALRAYSPAGNRTQVISVSIDPTQEGLQRMQQYLAQLGGRATPASGRVIAANLQKALGMQNVTIKGVSPRTHFAQVLVEADYRMKKIGIGLEKPPVKIVSWVERTNPRSVARNAMQRWYFTPNYECVRASEDGFAMQLEGDGVKLIGEDELVVAGGARIASATVDRASKQFTESFTNKYGELAAVSPVYAQLRNLIDLSIAAAYIQQQDFYAHAGWQMEVFGDEAKYAVETEVTPKQVETAVNALWKGRTLMTPIGGGVNIQPRQAISPEHLMQDENGQVARARQETTVEGLVPGQWWWD